MDSAFVNRDAGILHQLLELQRQVIERLEGLGRQNSQSWYSPAEIARLIRRRPATVRGWCRTGQLAARKRMLGRGNKLEWEVSADELQRFRDHGLAPRGVKRV